MTLPRIDISELPDLGTPTGMFGSIHDTQMEDAMIILMAYVFEIDPPAGP
jgi:hypothetical protein